MKESEEQTIAIRRLLWGKKGMDESKDARPAEFSIDELLGFLRKMQRSVKRK